MVKNLPALRETQVWFLGLEDPLQKGMATQSSILAWRIPWTRVWWATVHGVAKIQKSLDLAISPGGKNHPQLRTTACSVLKTHWTRHACLRTQASLQSQWHLFPIKLKKKGQQKRHIYTIWNYTAWHLKNMFRDFPSGPVVKNLPFNAGCMGLILR